MTTPPPQTITVTIPSMDPHALRQASKGQVRLSHILAYHGADFACLVVSGLHSNRLKYNMQLWHFDAGELRRCNGKITRTVLEEIIGHYAGMARDIAKRYPEKNRPDTIVMGSDGKSLMINPGRLAGQNAEWLLHHVAGESPAAMLIEENSLLSKIAHQ